MYVYIFKIQIKNAEIKSDYKNTIRILNMMKFDLKGFLADLQHEL